MAQFSIFDLTLQSEIHSKSLREYINKRIFDKRANLLSRMFLLLDVFGCVCGNKGSRVDDDLSVFEDNLSLHSRLDLPRGGNLLFLAGLPFF